MLGLGSVFAIVLLVASEKLKVKVDPKIEQIHKSLPNIDCGACGFAGCGQYAKAVLGDPKLIGLCAPGGGATAEKIAAILNLQVSHSGPPEKPIVHCHAKDTQKTHYAAYQGISACITANSLNAQACKFGCLGFGDCVSACKFSALSIIDGLATIDYDKCTGCTACTKACPRDLIVMIPFSEPSTMTVACSSKENGKATRSMCKVGCIGCSLCVKQSEIFSVTNNLAKVDYEKYKPSEQTKTAVAKCPTKVIVYRGRRTETRGRMTEKNNREG